MNRPCITFTFVLWFPVVALAGHDASFWKQIRSNKFAVPPNESVDKLASELVDLTASTDPVVRDECGYEIFATWVYRDHRLNDQQLELLREKLLPGMTFQIGETGTDSIFRRSFSALFISVLAAEDLQKPFLSAEAFNETLAAALQCYANEKDLRGYVLKKGWAHATAHVADLLKFLGRNTKLGHDDQATIVAAIAQRSRSAPSVFIWGEEDRMAAALISIAVRKDLDNTIFDEWFQKLTADNQKLWAAPTLSVADYVGIRNQINVLIHLAAQLQRRPADQVKTFRETLNATLTKLT